MPQLWSLLYLMEFHLMLQLLMAAYLFLGESLFLEIDIKNIRISRDWVGDNWVNLETKPNILSLIPAKNNMLKSESSPFSSKETLELVDLEHVDPEPVDPESINHKPIDPESIDHKPVDPKHGDDFNENKPPQEGDPEFHEKEKDPGLALDDNNVQTVEQGLLSISSSLDGWAKCKGSHVFEQPQKVEIMLELLARSCLLELIWITRRFGL